MRQTHAHFSLRYFVAANPSIQRHVYSVPLPDLDLLATQTNPKFKEPTQITDKEHPGYYTTKFSPEAGFYVLSYHGPGIPWTRVVEGGKPDGSVALYRLICKAQYALQAFKPTLRPTSTSKMLLENLKAPL